MRQCFSCKVKKELKSINIEDCDCHSELSPGRMFDVINHSVCKNCFFESCNISEDGTAASEALEEIDNPDHDRAKRYSEHWNDYDYYWRERK